MEAFPNINGVSKKILYSGKGEIPKYEDGTKVIFHFKTQSLEENGEVLDVIDDSKKIGKPMEIIFGKQFKMPVWEECLKTMKLDEVSEFKVEKKLVDAYPLVSKSFREFAGISKSQKGHCCGMMAFSEGIGHKDLDTLIRLPKDLTFTLELTKVEFPGQYEKESWSMAPEEKLESIPKLKELGNQLFKEGRYEEAGKMYAEGLGRLEQLILREKPGDSEWIALDQLKIPFLLNYTQCKLLLKDYYPAIEYTTTVLENDSKNCKALYRRAKAYIGTWDLDLAREDLKRLSELDPTFNKTVQKELQNIASLQKQKDDDIKSKLLGKV